MFDIREFLVENRELLERTSVDHALRQAITDFVWSPDARKKREIIALLDRYLEEKS